MNDMLEPQYDQLEQRVISVRTITIVSSFEGSAMDGESYRNRLSSKYSHQVLTGIGASYTIAFSTAANTARVESRVPIVIRTPPSAKWRT